VCGGAAAARRRAAGLPADAFVFACFNQLTKVQPTLAAALS
jgi:predicted O-linked N-acetylglucosamine transferase (SPINDLY family)